MSGSPSPSLPGALRIDPGPEPGEDPPLPLHERAAFLDRVRELIRERYGFWIKDMWYEQLHKSLEERRKLLGNLSQRGYLERLASAPLGQAEISELMEMVFICETSFFRNPPQLEAFKRVVLPEVLARRPGARARIASVGCSTGEEPYSIAIAALQALGPEAQKRVEIFGVDACRWALRKAREGRYADLQLRELKPGERTCWFHRDGDSWRIREAPRSMVNFLHGNIAGALPMGAVDILFCCNVLIYFQAPAFERALRSFHGAMNPDACLFLGHSESIQDHAELFQRVISGDAVFYRRRGVPVP